MPILPSVASFDRPTPKPAGGVVSVSPFPVGIEEARATAVAGQQLTHASLQMSEVLEREQERIDATRAEEAFNSLRQRQLDLTFGEEEGFINRRGSAAINKPLLPEYSSKFSGAVGEIESTLGNERQKDYFRKRAQVSELQFREDILRHLQRESGEHAKQVFVGTVDVETQNATARWNEPLAVDGSLKRIENAVNREAERAGWTPEAKQAALITAKSGVHKAVISQALAAGDIVFAKKYFDENREAIDLQTARATEGAVQDAEQKQLSNGYRSAFIESRNSIPRLQQLEAAVQKDKTLSEDRKNSLLGPIASRIDVLTNRYEMRRDQQLRAVEKQIGRMENMVLQGYELPANQVESVLAATKGTPLEAQGQQLVRTSMATQAFRLSPPAQQEVMLNRLESDVRTNPTPEKIEILTKFRAISDNQRRQINEEPVAFAYRQGLAEPQVIDFSNPMSSSEQIIEQINVAKGMSARYGAPLKPLMPDQLADIRSRLEKAKPEQKLAWFGQLRQATGADPTGYSAIMGQIAPDDPVLAMAGDFTGKGRNEPARLMLGGQELLRPVSKTDGKPDQGKIWPMPPEKETRERFLGAERDAFAGKGAFRSAAYQSTLAIYAKLSEEAGDATGEINRDRFDKAMKMAVGGIEKVNGKGTILPYGMEKSDFQKSLNLRIDEIAGSGRLGPNLSATKLRGLPVEPISDGRYVFVSGNAYLVDKNGQRIVVNFNLPGGEPETTPVLPAPARGEIVEGAKPIKR